jgi:Protein of unknown function (DUF2892)
MHAERIVHIVAGSFILFLLVLGTEASPIFVEKYFLFLTAFVGMNLFQSGFTKRYFLQKIFSQKSVSKTVRANK